MQKIRENRREMNDSELPTYGYCGNHPGITSEPGEGRIFMPPFTLKPLGDKGFRIGEGGEGSVGQLQEEDGKWPMNHAVFHN